MGLLQAQTQAGGIEAELSWAADTTLPLPLEAEVLHGHASQAEEFGLLTSQRQTRETTNICEAGLEMASSDDPKSQRHWPGVGVGRSQDEFLECLGSPRSSVIWGRGWSHFCRIGT